MSDWKSTPDSGPSLRVIAGSACLVVGVILMVSAAAELEIGDSPMLVVGGGFVAVAGLAILGTAVARRMRDKRKRQQARQRRP